MEGKRDPRALAIVLRIALDARGGEAGRAAAAREIGVLGRGRPEARHALESLLASATWRVRREAIGALAQLRDTAAIEALRAHHARSALVPELLAIEAAVQSLQGDG
jgi:HEAT repeat protein